MLYRHASEIPSTLGDFLKPIGTSFTAKDIVDLALAALDIGCQKPDSRSTNNSDWCVFDMVRTLGPVLSGIGNSTSNGALSSALSVLTNPDFLCSKCTIAVVSALDRASYSSRVVGAYKTYVQLIVNFVVASCDPNGGPKANATFSLPAELGGKNNTSSSNTPALSLSDGSCNAGFGGPECNICLADSGCAAVNASAGVCGKGAVVVASQSNSLCTVDEPMLSTLYPGAAITVSLARSLLTASASGSVYYGNKLNFKCSFTGCSRQVTATSDIWSCPTAKCECVKGTKMCGEPGALVDLSSPLQSVTGPFQLDCPYDSTGNGTECRFKVDQLKGILPNGLKLSGCNHGECLASARQQAEVIGAAPKEAPGSTTNMVAVGVGAGIVGLLLLGLAACFGVAKSKQVKARKVVVDNVGSRGADLAFENVTYTIGKTSGKNANKAKVVLDNISGKAMAGRITAIMGPSGSGKSSLLDVVAGKAKAGKIAGTFALDAAQVKRSKLRKVVGFVDQEDHFLPYMTVRECIAFAARCRLPEGLAEPAREARVDAVLETLGLTHVANTRVGGNGVRGVSGGERRRVSIACELVTGSGIVALDEPTSGLDSHTAASLLRTLKDLAVNENKTIVLSIHQPSSDVFRLIDDLVLLSKGRVLYAGEARAAKGHFASMGYMCPEDYNVADYLLDLAVEEADSLAAGTDAAPPRTASFATTGTDVEKMAAETEGSFVMESGSSQRYLVKSALGEEEETEPEGADYFSVASAGANGTMSSTSAQQVPQVSALTRLGAVMGRSWRTLLRDPSLLVAHLGIAVLLGVLVGGLYFKSPATIGGLQNKLGGVFFILALMGFSALSALGVFGNERLLFVRERAGNYYGSAAFSINKLIFDLVPLRIIPALIVGSIAYWMIGLVPQAANFLKFLLILVLFNCAAALFCMSIAAAVGNQGTANLICSIFMLFSMLFGGFLINLSNIPKALSWIQYLSIFRYATEALAVNEAADSYIVDDFDGIPINIPAVTILTKLFGFDVGSYWTDAFVMIGWVVGLALVFVALVKWKLVERK